MPVRAARAILHDPRSIAFARQIPLLFALVRAHNRSALDVRTQGRAMKPVAAAIRASSARRKAPCRAPYCQPPLPTHLYAAADHHGPTSPEPDSMDVRLSPLFPAPAVHDSFPLQIHRIP